MKYKHLLFDLDHTLWDYDTNAKETLADLYSLYQLDKHELFEVSEFIDTFFQVNNELWTAYNHDRIKKGYIRENRFKQIFERLRLPLRHYPLGIDDNYLHSCPQKTHKIPFADEILTYLQPQYELHILTNGFNDVQSVKLERSGLNKYFREVITSESAEAKKPSAKIFEHTMNQIDASIDETLMIGDNLNTDIKGARDFGIDQVYFNPENNQDYEATFSINSLLDLKNVLPV